MNLTIRARHGMPSLLKDEDHTIAVIKDESYCGLLGSVALLREQLSLAVYILDSLNMDTGDMKLALRQSEVAVD